MVITFAMPADQSGSVLESGSLIIVDGLWLMLGDSSLRFTTTRVDRVSA